MTTNLTQQNINKLFDEYLDTAPQNESIDEMIEALHDVVYEALLEKLGYTNSCSAQKKLVRLKMNEFMMNMEFNSPSLAHAEKMLKSIGHENFKGAAEYLVKLYEHRTKLISQAQSARAKQPRGFDPVTTALSLILKRNPEITAKEAINILESDLYSHLIAGFDEDSIWYTDQNGLDQAVDKLNIPPRIARLRKK